MAEEIGKLTRHHRIAV
jgi:DNA primase large subunit